MNDSPRFERLGYLGSRATIDGARAALVGLPYDGTASFRAGSRLAPDAIRQASVGNLETWDPVLGRDLEDIPFADLGDLQIAQGMDAAAFIETARTALAQLPAGIPLLGLGGEHSVTLPLVEHALQIHPELGLLVFDAHTDLREQYAGTPHSHACVVRRVMDRIGPERIAMIGVRSGERDEFELAARHQLLFPATDDGFENALAKLGDRPLYVSVDLDGFDPMELPGTGTPEAGGFFWRDMAGWLQRLIEPKADGHAGGCVVAGDIVELLPAADPTGRSTVLAARMLRALLLLVLGQR